MFRSYQNLFILLFYLSYSFLSHLPLPPPPPPLLPPPCPYSSPLPFSPPPPYFSPPPPLFSHPSPPPPPPLPSPPSPLHPSPLLPPPPPFPFPRPRPRPPNSLVFLLQLGRAGHSKPGLASLLSWLLFDTAILSVCKCCCPGVPISWSRTTDVT